ncbi:MAG: hypothetical protein NTW05_14985, partial [Pseudonocardiales bacterium]|nr:hypothetical protein [Pseudonocardiales bacterium]
MSRTADGHARPAAARVRPSGGTTARTATAGTAARTIVDQDTARHDASSVSTPPTTNPAAPAAPAMPDDVAHHPDGHRVPGDGHRSRRNATDAATISSCATVRGTP